MPDKPLAAIFARNIRLLCANSVFIKHFEETAVSSKLIPNESVALLSLCVIPA